MSKKVLVIGHRGAKGHVAENTLASIKKALDQNVDGIELDVHTCASGELVVFHDFTLDRVTNGSGEVANSTFSELKKLTVNNAFSIPTLEEVLDLVDKKCLINIELKGKYTVSKTIALIEDYVANHNWDFRDFIVSSFQFDLLRQVFETNKNVQIGVLTDVNIDDALTVAKELNAVAIHPDYTMLTQENVMKIQTNGFKVFTWTVNDQETIKRIKDYNVDGIISDYPERI